MLYRDGYEIYVIAATVGFTSKEEHENQEGAVHSSGVQLHQQKFHGMQAVFFYCMSLINSSYILLDTPRRTFNC